MHTKEWSEREPGRGEDFRAFVCIDAEPGCLPVMSSEKNSIAGEAAKEGQATMIKQYKTKSEQSKTKNYEEDQPGEVC